MYDNYSTRPVNYSDIKELDIKEVNKNYHALNVTMSFKGDFHSFDEAVKKRTNGIFDTFAYLQANGFFADSFSSPDFTVSCTYIYEGEKSEANEKKYAEELKTLLLKIMPEFEALPDPVIKSVHSLSPMLCYDSIVEGGWLVCMTHYIPSPGMNAFLTYSYRDAENKEVVVPACCTSKKEAMQLAAMYNDCVGEMPKLKKLDKDTYLYYNKYQNRFRPDRCGMIYHVSKDNIGWLRQKFHDVVPA